jgi:DNA invertase Pin-like site-specific DNA recombinase
VVTVTEKTVKNQTTAPPELLIARNVKRCAIYIRVSTAEQRIEGWSLEAQEAGLRAEAEKKGWKVVGIYADEGKTARKRLKDRKAIHRLMDDVKAGLVDVILFKELDRWFRSISDFYKIQDILDVYGVEWFSQQQPSLEMKTKEGRLQVNVLLSVGQNETDAGSDRIKYTQKYLRQQKRWPSGAWSLPRCYTLDEDQHVILDESPGRAEYVRALIDNFFRYGAVQRAMKETNEIYPPGMLYNNVVSLLRNPMLYGKYHEVEDFVEKPLMTKKEWEKMQGLMTRNARDTERLTYIFAGLMTCSCCGLKMAGTHTTKTTKKGGEQDYKYYRCRRAKVQGTCTNKGSLNEEKLEQDLMAYVKESVAEQIVKVKSVKAAKKPKKARKNNRESIELQLDKLEDLYITNDRMTKEKYEAKKAAILAKLVEDDEPEEKLPDLADLEKIQALFDSGVEDLYKDFSPEERREFWRGILTEIKVEGYRIMDVDFIE